MRGLLLAVAALSSGCLLQQALHVEEVSLGERFEAVLGGGGNSVVLFHGEDAFAVDVKFGDFARRLRREVVHEHKHHLRRILLTHSHPDHTGGLGLFGDTEVVMVHPNTRARLVAQGMRARWVEIEREATLILGNEEVRIIHPGRGHTDGDLVAYFPNRKLLATGDLLLEGTLPFADQRAGGNLLEYSRALERLAELDFEQVVPGHGKVVKREDFETLRLYLKELKKQSALALAKGLTAEAAEKEVKVFGFDGLKDFPLGGTRATNARDMVAALAAERASRGN